MKCSAIILLLVSAVACGDSPDTEQPSTVEPEPEPEHARPTISPPPSAATMSPAAEPNPPDAGTKNTAPPTVDDADSGAPTTPEQDAATAPDSAVQEPSGACTNAADQALFADPMFDPEAKAPPCVVPMALGGGGPGSPGFVPGVAECLAEDTGITVECATCYAINAECSFASCGVICLPDRNSKECRDCRCGRTSEVNCFPQLDACSGIPSHYCD